MNDCLAKSVAGFAVTLVMLGGCTSKAKKALGECQKADGTSSAGLKTCHEAWKAHAEAPEFSSLTEAFDLRLDAACKDTSRIKDCDTYCPLRIADPGPKYKTLTLSMCAMRGYGTIDGQVTTSKPARVSAMSPEVIEACVSECRDKASNPSSPEYQGCFSSCKTRKVSELNSR